MQYTRHPRAEVSGPTGANQEVLIYQDSDGTTVAPAPNAASPYSKIVVPMKFDQDVTFLHKWGPTPTTADGDLVTINGTTQTGETATAAAGWQVFEARLYPGRNRFSVKAGATPPSAAQVAWELSSYPGVGQ